MTDVIASSLPSGWSFKKIMSTIQPAINILYGIGIQISVLSPLYSPWELESWTSATNKLYSASHTRSFSLFSTFLQPDFEYSFESEGNHCSSSRTSSIRSSEGTSNRPRSLDRRARASFTHSRTCFRSKGRNGMKWSTRFLQKKIDQTNKVAFYFNFDLIYYVSRPNYLFFRSNSFCFSA